MMVDTSHRTELFQRLSEAALYDPYIRRCLDIYQHGESFENALMACILALSETNKKLRESNIDLLQRQAPEYRIEKVDADLFFRQYWLDQKSQTVISNELPIYPCTKYEEGTDYSEETTPLSKE